MVRTSVRYRKKGIRSGFIYLKSKPGRTLIHTQVFTPSGIRRLCSGCGCYDLVNDAKRCAFCVEFS